MAKQLPTQIIENCRSCPDYVTKYCDEWDFGHYFVCTKQLAWIYGSPDSIHEDCPLEEVNAEEEK